MAEEIHAEVTGQGVAEAAPGGRVMTFAATPEDREDRIADLDALIEEARTNLGGGKNVTPGHRPSWLSDPVAVQGYKDRLGRLIAHRDNLIAQRPANVPWWRSETVWRRICWGIIAAGFLVALVAAWNIGWHFYAWPE